MRLILIFFVLLLAGCGYHVPGTPTPGSDTPDTWVGGDAQVLYIQLFENQTSNPYLENYITNALVAEVSKSRIVTLTENQDLADVVLTGEVNDFDSSAFAYGTTDRITDYRATIKISARLEQKDNGEVLWQAGFQRSENYLGAVNKNLQLEAERVAALLISQRLSEDLYASLLNSF